MQSSPLYVCVVRVAQNVMLVRPDFIPVVFITSILFVRRSFYVVLTDASSKDCWSRIQEDLELVSRILKGILLSLTPLYQASSSYPLFVVMCLALKDTYHALSFLILS